MRLSPSLKVAPPKFISKPTRKLARLQISQHLRFMDALQHLDRFQLHNDTVSHDEIQSVRSHGPASILHHKCSFRTRKGSVVQAARRKTRSYRWIRHKPGPIALCTAKPQSIVSNTYSSVSSSSREGNRIMTFSIVSSCSSCHRVECERLSQCQRPFVVSVSFRPVKVVTRTVVPSVSTDTAPSLSVR